MKVCKLKINGSTMVLQAPTDRTKWEHHGLFEELAMFVEEAAKGEAAEIVIDEMTQEQYDSLPEFEGW